MTTMKELKKSKEYYSDNINNPLNRMLLDIINLWEKDIRDELEFLILIKRETRGKVREEIEQRIIKLGEGYIE